MATLRRVKWRRPAFVAAFAVLAWVGFEVGRAGHDIPPPHLLDQSTLSRGVISGKRIDGRAWSLDYDTATMSADATSATIAHVRDGHLHRPGKPDILVTADGVTINTVTNDLTIAGPVRLTEPLGDGKTRIFRTVGAQYIGMTRTLVIDHPSTIEEGGATLTVSTIRADFRSGKVVLGRIVGTRPGKNLP
jgi:hypothetical protein